MPYPAPTTVLYRRDLLGRIIAAGTPADPKAFGAWSYRGDGALHTETLKAGEGAGVTPIERSFGYDPLGRPVSIDEPAMRLEVSYRQDGDTAHPYANGGITAETVTYHAAGFPAGAVVPSSSATAYTYDAFRRLVRASSTGRPVLNVEANYDDNGNLTSLAQTGATQTYSYDEGTSRLAKVTPDGSPARAYAHDAAGAVTDAGGAILVHDPATRRMRRGTRGKESVSVLRDGRGRIVLTIHGAAKRLTLRDGRGAILLDRGSASLAAAHIHGTTGRIGLWTGGGLRAVSKDLRGSTRLLYDPDAKAVAVLSYFAYGEHDPEASSPDALTAAIRNRYTGQDWLEPLGLYDYGARLYDPTLGRFLSPDPKDETPSPFMYVAGDPVNAVDPDGEGGLLAFWMKKNGEMYFFDSNGSQVATFWGRGGSEYAVYHLKREYEIFLMNREYMGLSRAENPFWPVDSEIADGEDVLPDLLKFIRKGRVPYDQKLFTGDDNLFSVCERIKPKPTMDFPNYLSFSQDEKKSLILNKALTSRIDYEKKELLGLGFSELEILIMSGVAPRGIANPLVLDLRGLRRRELVLNLRGLRRREVTNRAQLRNRRTPVYSVQTAMSDEERGALLFPSTPTAPSVELPGLNPDTST
jgi:RHS repeat-associated protein